jgi:DNA-binding MarR family transcriptional regulator
MANYQLSVELFRAVKQFKKIGLNELLFDRCSFSQMAVLDTVIRTGPHGARMSELSEKLHLSRPAASQIVGKLEEKDLVERTMSGGDRRSVHVVVTEAGQALFHEQKERAMKMTDKVIDKVGNENVLQLISLLNLFYTELENSVHSKEK